MKKTLITALILCSFSTAFAQDLIDRVIQDAIVRDSLQKRINTIEADNRKEMVGLQDSITRANEQIKVLQKNYAEVAQFKEEKQAILSQLSQKSDSIASLKSDNAAKDTQIALIQQKAEQTAEQRFQDGKAEVVASISKTYANKTFDELLLFSTKESVQRDLPLIGNNPDIKQTLSNMMHYFSAKELLANKFDEAQIKKAQNQLNSINKESNLLDKLKENLENYKIYNDGLKETINKIKAIDDKETADTDFIQKAKLEKILVEISPYFFNYDFNYVNYPYLSEIVLEIMKRKQPNADADISDLKDKL